MCVYIHDRTFVDHSEGVLNYTDFINKELVLFSIADNKRSIPSVMDGLKPGQRKILFGYIDNRGVGMLKRVTCYIY